MAFFKDSRCLEIICENSSLKEISSEGVPLILAETELVLRKLVKDAVKYSKKFRRTKIKAADLKIAFQNHNFDLISGKNRRNSRRGKDRRERNGLQRKMEHIRIGKEINEIIKHSLVKKRKLGMEVNWFLISGEINQQLTVKEKELRSLNVKRYGLPGGKADIEQILPEQRKNVFQIKELTPNVLTRVRL